MTYCFDGLTEDIRAAARQSDAPAAVRAVLQAAVVDADAMLAASPKDGDDEIHLFEDDTVSIWICRFMPDVIVPPHEHRMPVLIAGYGGAEKSILYTRTADGLAEQGSVTAHRGEVIALGTEAIHAVTADGGEPSFAIHVYFGPLMQIKRDLFDWETGGAVDFTMENFDAMKRPITP